MRRIAVALVLLTLSAAPAAGQTLTTKDIVDLTKAGLGEEVLTALIEVHRSVFPIDRATLKMLKDEGVRDNVIVAMIRSGRDAIPAPPPPPPAPTPSVIVDRGDGTPELIVSDRAPEQTRVVVVEEREEPRYERRSRAMEDRVREVPVAVPVYVPVPARRHVAKPETPKRSEPVYWGFGGKLRPDAWKPSGSGEQPPPKKKDAH